MYRQIILLVFGVLSILSVAAQGSVEKLFQSMPDDLLWLDQTQRRDLFAYFTDKKVDSIGNNLNGYCKLVDYNETAKHLSINTSQKGNMELQILGNESVQFVGVIFTVCAPACHSSIHFYSFDWKPIDMQFPVLAASDFCKDGLSEDDRSAANRLLTPLFVRYSFQGGTNDIIASCSAESFLAETDFKQLKPLLKSDKIIISYQDGLWKLQK
ncbi:MAG: hypothetical protein H6Q17_2734 [Bacteroidetes bacterium]|nr:hypothetical protein [Bacteroidota bacterium]